MSRRRYVWDDELKQLVEVGGDWTNTPRRAQTNTEELVYGKARATDGTDISTRSRHREYMRRHNLTTADDFKDTWRKAAKEREQISKGEYGRAGRREAVARALYQFHKP